MTENTSLRKIIGLILINLIPFLLIIISIPDLIDAINSPGAYPFGSDTNVSASIYASQLRYVTYRVVETAFLTSLILSSFFYKKYRLIYFVLLAVNILLFVYPILTAEYLR